MYNSDGVPLKQEEAVDSMILYWKEINQKRNNDMLNIPSMDRREM